MNRLCSTNGIIIGSAYEPSWVEMDAKLNGKSPAVDRTIERPYHGGASPPQTDRRSRQPVKRELPVPERTSRFFLASDLQGVPIPPRVWLVPAFIPSNTVTLLSGDGGSGKSQIALQLACAAVTGSGWLGQSVMTGRALYLSAEDDVDELHRRLNDVAQEAGVGLDHLGGLTLRSLAGEDALLAHKTPTGLVPSPLFTELEDAARALPDLRLIVLDTLADLFPGNENDRAETRQFVGLVRGLAIRQGCAVLLLSHPSLTGLNSGSGASGSTAWSNSVRSRLYLERIKGEDGHEADPDRRSLSVKKSNYARTGAELTMRWKAGVFVADAPSAPLTGLDRISANSKAERVFERLLALSEEQGWDVNHTGSTSYAPVRFAAHPESEGVTKAAFASAMHVLMGRGAIEAVKIGPPSRQRSVLRVKREGLQPPFKPAVRPLFNPPSTPLQPLFNPPSHTPPLYRGGCGRRCDDRDRPAMTVTRTPLDASTPVTLADLKARARIDYSDEDTHLLDLLREAASDFEAATNLALLPTRITATLAGVEQSWNALPVGPVAPGAEVTVHQLDAAQGVVPLTGWRVEPGNAPALYLYRFDTAQPVRVTYTAALAITPAALPANAPLANAPLAIAKQAAGTSISTSWSESA